VIDGDGTIFSSDLIAQGQAGGYSAAQILTEYTQQYFLNNYSLDQFQLWTYVFYNKRGLVEAIGRAGFFQAKSKLDDFMIGFNQAAGRFLMVDVGSGKEVGEYYDATLVLIFGRLQLMRILADAKVKVRSS
jgi:hypothetical protein